MAEYNSMPFPGLCLIFLSKILILSFSRLVGGGYGGGGYGGGGYGGGGGFGGGGGNFGDAAW